MSQSQQKLVQYLNEAHATEAGLVRVLQSQIAMTPRGSYRDLLEKHLGETRNHAERVRDRIGQLDGGANPLQAGIGAVETIFAQTLALWKTPFDLVRGTSGEEKILKNAKDTSATEAWRSRPTSALERVATAVGDDVTARLAKSIRADEERMLERVTREIPKLAAAVVGAEIDGDPSYDVTKTGAADAARTATRRSTTRAKRRARGAQGAGRRARRGRREGCGGLGQATCRSRATTSHGQGDRRPAERAVAGRPRQGRGLRAQRTTAARGARPHLLAPGR